MRTGPETEKRFPPLKVPPAFKATLFACDPLIEYPSVLALGPRSNSIFLAHDYMTGLGEKIVRKDEIRLVEDTDGDGYADTSTVWAGGFNSIQGLACHDGRVFVMHSPLLTVLRDLNGDGIADERGDVLSGLGWPPEKSTDRLHGANGVVVVPTGGFIWRWETEAVMRAGRRETGSCSTAGAFSVAGRTVRTCTSSPPGYATFTTLRSTTS